MGADLFSWDDLRLVLAVAETRALAPAAARLGLNGSTLFRRLGRIEARLGTKLFERHRSGYVATVPGQDMATLARHMDEEITGLSRRLSGGAPSPSGEIRVTTNDTLLVHLLAPIFARFRQRYPDITLDVAIGNAALNLSRRDADVAVRATDKPPDNLVGRKVATIGWALYGRGPAGEGPGICAERLAGSDWVALSDDLAPGASMLLRYTERPRVVCRVNTVLALVAAVEAGIGIAPLPCLAADKRPALVRLAPPDPALATALWLLTHPDLRTAPRIRALMDVLAEEIAAERATIAGDAPTS